MAIVIQSGIPMPVKNEAPGLMTDLRQLLAARVGDSAFFEKPEGTSAKTWKNRVSSSITNIGPGWATYVGTSEAVEGRVELVEGVRVWKKADLGKKSTAEPVVAETREPAVEEIPNDSTES